VARLWPPRGLVGASPLASPVASPCLAVGLGLWLARWPRLRDWFLRLYPPLHGWLSGRISPRQFKRGHPSLGLNCNLQFFRLNQLLLKYAETVPRMAPQKRRARYLERYPASGPPRCHAKTGPRRPCGGRKSLRYRAGHRHRQPASRRQSYLAQSAECTSACWPFSRSSGCGYSEPPVFRDSAGGFAGGDQRLHAQVGGYRNRSPGVPQSRRSVAKLAERNWPPCKRSASGANAAGLPRWRSRAADAEAFVARWTSTGAWEHETYDRPACPGLLLYAGGVSASPHPSATSTVPPEPVMLVVVSMQIRALLLRKRRWPRCW